VAFWRDPSEIGASAGARSVFEPSLSADRRESLCAGWKRAVERSRGWVEEEA
jgi:glycerol kinase